MKHKSQPAKEGLVYVVNDVSGEDDYPREALNVIEEHSHIHIGIPVSGGAAEVQNTYTSHSIYSHNYT